MNHATSEEPAVVNYPDLANKRVLITGASVGIGSGMARAFARQGCRLILHFNSHETEVRLLAGEIAHLCPDIRTVQCDFKKNELLPSFAKEALSIYDGIDIAINNAGVVPKTGTTETTESQFDDVFSINLKAPYFISKHIAMNMISKGTQGAIINNTSIHGRETCENFTLYAMTKAALETMTKVQSTEFAPQGVRVNGIAPGVTLVERNQEWLNNDKERWLPHIPANRYGTPEDIAEATLFLASDASKWITGSILTVDGGHIARGNYPFRKEF